MLWFLISLQDTVLTQGSAEGTKTGYNGGRMYPIGDFLFNRVKIKTTGGETDEYKAISFASKTLTQQQSYFK